MWRAVVCLSKGQDYPLPAENSSGSAPHRAPVLNHYFQVCGTKQWHVADHGASLGGDLDSHRFLVQAPDMERFMSHPQVYRGHTEPGDHLLNPPWLWHLVQTAAGFNFAVTYKQTKFAWWANLMKMDPMHADFNFRDVARKRGQAFPDRPVHTIDTSKLNVSISTLNDVIVYLVRYGMPAHVWLSLAPEDFHHAAFAFATFAAGIMVGSLRCSLYRCLSHRCCGLVVFLIAVALVLS